MEQQPIVTRKTLQIVVYAVVFLLFALALLFIVRLFKKQAGKSGGGSATNPDGTPSYIPSTVDQSYIERIAEMIYAIHKEEDYSGFSSKRCEVAMNILGMRDEEVSVLSILLQRNSKLRLGATIGRWKGDGCFTSWFGGDIEKLQNKVKNY
jgi:hypothetical protein